MIVVMESFILNVTRLLRSDFTYYIVIIAEFEQINVNWSWETIVSDNKFVFSKLGIYNLLWAGKI